MSATERRRARLPLPRAGALAAALLLLIACGLQAGVFALARQGGGMRLLAGCLALQAVAAACAATALVRVVPARFRAQPRLPWAYLWLCNFGVPGGGLLLSCGALGLGRLMRREAVAVSIESVDEPQFVSHLISNVSYGRGARLKAQLQNAAAATSYRMTALIAMQSMPSRAVSPLLRGLLSDPLDDIRLLAYGMLDNQEKVLTQRILAERPKLADATTDAERFDVNKTLAELYGELIYAQLVHGDVYRNAADQADAYAAAALALRPDAAALWRMRGRLALDRDDLDAADRMLQRAIDCGFPRDRMLPYLAEAAYQRRDFARTAALLREIVRSGAPPMLHPLLEYWT